jgi:hypothetical protein
MIGELTHIMGVLTGWVAILMPVLMLWVIFYFSSKNDKEKYATMVEIAKLLLFGLVNIAILKGVGLLVICIGLGSLIAGYIYPNNSEEIDKAVEKFEKK